MQDRLIEISRAIYGDRAVLRVVSPGKLRLLRRNARYMKKETFDQLSDNLSRDGMMTSIPLCHPIAERVDWQECPEQDLEVLSGNHRVKGASRSGLQQIVVLVIPHQDDEQKVAIQLSHNSISGSDDQQILAELWSELRSIDAKLYSGLDSETINELEKIKFHGFTAEPVRTEKVVLWFLPEEVEDLDRMLTACAEILAADRAYMAPLERYGKLFAAIAATKKRENIKNTAVAFMRLIDLVHEANERAESIGSDAPGDQPGEGCATHPPRSGAVTEEVQ